MFPVGFIGGQVSYIKGTIDVISRDPLFVGVHVQFTTVSFKPLSDQGGRIADACAQKNYFKNIILFWNFLNCVKLNKQTILNFVNSSNSK